MNAFGRFAKRTRLKLKLGLREAAREMNISAAYLSRVESGEDPPSGELMARMADLYELNVERLSSLVKSAAAAAAAHGHHLKGSPELRALYRIGNELGAEELDRLLREALRQKEYSDEEIETKIRELKAELPRIAKSNDDLLAAQASPRFLSRAKITSLAYNFLRRHGLDEDSYAPPTEVEMLVEMEPGIDYRIDLLKCHRNGQPFVLGLTRWNLEGDRQIVINAALADSPRPTDIARFNFTLGHELFHALEHLPLTSPAPGATAALNRAHTDLVIVDRCGDKRSAAEKAVSSWVDKAEGRQLLTEEDWREWQANTFSSAILMPEWAVTCEFTRRVGTDVAWVSTGNPREVALHFAGEFVFGDVAFEQSIAEKFAVSRQAMAIRLLQLGLVKEG